MFKSVYLLAIVACATYTATNNFVDFCSCRTNETEYKAKYEDKYNQYKLNIDNIVNFIKPDIEKRLDIVKNSKRQCGLPLSTDDYLKPILETCGGELLDRFLEPSWWNRELEIDHCNFIVEKFPALETQLKSLEDVAKNCVFMMHFDKTFQTIIDGCIKGCEL